MGRTLDDPRFVRLARRMRNVPARHPRSATVRHRRQVLDPTRAGWRARVGRDFPLRSPKGRRVQILSVPGLRKSWSEERELQERRRVAQHFL